MTTDREAQLAQFWKNREALERERNHVGIAGRRFSPPPEPTFARAVAARYSGELNLTAADYVGFEPTGVNGYTVADVRKVASARDVLAG